MADIDASKFMGTGGSGGVPIGPALASAATIAPVTKITHVTGVASIVNITPPHDGFVGPIYLIADGAWTWTAAGNIAVACTTVVTVGKFYGFVYDPATAKWYPGVVLAAS